MTATAQMKVCTGTSAGTESPTGSEAANLNWLNVDNYDSTGTLYQTNRLAIPASGTGYSYERWLRWVFTGTFTLIDNIKVYISAWTPSNTGLDIKGGVTATGTTPVNTASTIATTTYTSWDTLAEALTITPTDPINTSGEKTKYLVSQLNIPSTTVIDGDIGAVTLTLSYDES